MWIGSLKSRIRSWLDSLSSKCKTLVWGTKNRVSDILGKTLLASTLAFASWVAVSGQSDTSKLDADSSSWSIAYNVPSSAQGNIIDAIKNATFDTLMAPIVLKNTKSQEQNIDISDQEIALKHASDYQSDILTDNTVIAEIQKMPSEIQKDIQKNTESYTEKTDLESRLLGFLHEDYGKESTKIQLQDIKFHVQGVRSSEGKVLENQNLGQKTAQDWEKIIKDVFTKTLPSVWISTDSSSEVDVLTPVEKDFLHQTAKKYKLSGYHLIQWYNSGKLSLDPDEKYSMKQIFDDNRHLSISGNAHYTRTDTHNTPLPIGAFWLLVGWILGVKKLVKKKDDIVDWMKRWVWKIQWFLRKGFHALSGIFLSEKSAETVVDRLRVIVPERKLIVEENQILVPNKTVAPTYIEQTQTEVSSSSWSTNKISVNTLTPSRSKDNQTFSSADVANQRVRGSIAFNRWDIQTWTTLSSENDIPLSKGVSQESLIWQDIHWGNPKTIESVSEWSSWNTDTDTASKSLDTSPKSPDQTPKVEDEVDDLRLS